MRFEDFLNGLDNSISPYYFIEEFLISLLDLHISSQSKVFMSDNSIRNNKTIPHNNKNYWNAVQIIDGYAPDGFSDFKGGTAIEIKSLKNLASMREVFKRTANIALSLNNSGLTPPIKNLLILTPSFINSKAKLSLKKSLESIPLNCHIWDGEDIQKILDLHPEFEFEIKPSKVLAKKVLKNNYFDDEKWKSKRTEHLHNLKKQFDNDNLVLFLGAGTSLDAGIPSWDSLMSNLMVTLLNKISNSEDESENHINLTQDEKDFLAMEIGKRNGSSPLQLVRFIRNGLGESFQKELRNVLYRKCTNKSSILESIANLSVPSRQGIGIQGIVTYNFDDLIEYNLEKRKVINYRSVFQEADMPSKNELGIYHVHGFLPRRLSEKNEVMEDIQKQNNTLVFSEEKYHDLLLDGYHWANLVQLNYFRERTCLFIGVSMTDPNVRRLLEIARRKQSDLEECNHYIILKRDDFSKIYEVSNNDKLRKNSIIKFSHAYQNLKEAELKELGLNVIWIEDFNEIPTLLDELRKQ
jgi:hypothetical protein